MDLEIIMESQISHLQKIMYDSTYMKNLIETQSRIVDAWSWGEEKWEVVFESSFTFEG